MYQFITPYVYQFSKKINFNISNMSKRTNFLSMFAHTQSRLQAFPFACKLKKHS